MSGRLNIEMGGTSLHGVYFNGIGHEPFQLLKQSGIFKFNE